MYYGGYSNDFFYMTPVYACSGYARVQSTVYGDTTNCPFTNQQLDINFWNDPIVEAVDGNNGKCVGTGNANGLSTVGYLGSCGNIYGSGAIQGAFNVLAPCAGGDNIVNRYWTNNC